jgi:putative transposase
LGYTRFVKEGMAQGRKPELFGEGLFRSLGGWSQVLSLRRSGEKVASDERILGSGEFVESLLDEAEEREKETLRLRGKLAVGSLARPIVRDEGITETGLRSGSRRKKIVKARRRFCQLAIMKLGYPGAQVSRFLGVTTAAAVRAARADEWSKIGFQP